MSNLRSDQIIKGSHLMVFMEVVDDQTHTSTLKPIAFATSHTFSKQLNTQEISCKDYGDAAAVVPQNYTWTCQTDNLYSVDGYKQVNDAFKEMKPITVYFGETTYNNVHQDSIVDKESAPNWEMSGFGEKGKAYITALDVTASAGENATFSATFTGTGTLENAGPEPGPTPTPGEYDITYNFDEALTDSNYTSRSDSGGLEYDATSADEGDTVTIECTNDLTDDMVEVTSSDVQLTAGTDLWTFDMPANDVTVTAKRKYEVKLVYTGTSYWNVTDANHNNKQYFLPGEEVHIEPTSSDYGPAHYHITSDPQEIQWRGESSSTYWDITMPDIYEDYNSYTYITATIASNI